MAEWAKYLLWAQGLYFLVTGVWPILSIRTFEAVTSPKADDWLVKTVGALITVVALVMLVAAWRDAASLEVALMAAGSAAALLIVDLVYVHKRVIPPIYLVDAVAELAILAAWAIAWLTG